MQNNLPHQKGRDRAGYLKIAVLFLAGLMSASAAWAQLSVSGKVTSGEDKEPLPGVNILVKGTTNGTISDVNGDYKLTVNSASYILVFSFVGFLSQETSINGIIQTSTSSICKSVSAMIARSI